MFHTLRIRVAPALLLPLAALAACRGGSNPAPGTAALDVKSLDIGDRDLLVAAWPGDTDWAAFVVWADARDVRP